MTGEQTQRHPVGHQLVKELFEENQLSRVQLLQDAATAFISIQQNDVVKVLTIASVVGVPPVLVVGVYGMNFRADAGAALGLGLSLRSGARWFCPR